MSWKVLVTARTMDETGEAAFRFLRESGCELIIPARFGPYPADQLVQLLPGVDAVLASMDQFTEAVFASPQAATLKMVSRWGVGYDAIDVGAATRHGVAIGYTPGLLNETVADFAFALLLGVARRVHVGHQVMSSGQWRGAWGHDVHGKTLGLVGCGRIGQAMARRASGFRMRLLGYDIAPSDEARRLGIEFVGLEALLEQSDFLSLHAALTRENVGLIGETQLRRMKPVSYLINTARGALVDEAALARALREGWIAGAAVDAYVVEPLPAEHPLRTAPNLLLTPHLASFARETGERVSMQAAQTLVELMRGRRPTMVVNPDVWRSSALRARVL